MKHPEKERVPKRSDFVIDKGIPVPNIKGRWRRYPFPAMEVDDSFGVDYDQDEERAVYNRLRSAATHYGQKNGKRFVVRNDKAGKIRCWRVE